MSGCILTASRTYIFLHTINSITCILHTELEVQPRLEVCWALDTHTGAPFQKAPGQHNQDKKKFCEKENTITIFYSHGLQTQKNEERVWRGWKPNIHHFRASALVLAFCLLIWGFEAVLFLSGEADAPSQEKLLPNYSTKEQHQESSGAAGATNSVRTTPLVQVFLLLPCFWCTLLLSHVLPWLSACRAHISRTCPWPGGSF